MSNWKKYDEADWMEQAEAVTYFLLYMNIEPTPDAAARLAAIFQNRRSVRYFVTLWKYCQRVMDEPAPDWTRDHPAPGNCERFREMLFNRRMSKAWTDWHGTTKRKPSST